MKIMIEIIGRSVGKDGKMNRWSFRMAFQTMFFYIFAPQKVRKWSNFDDLFETRWNHPRFWVGFPIEWNCSQERPPTLRGMSDHLGLSFSTCLHPGAAGNEATSAEVTPKGSEK